MSIEQIQEVPTLTQAGWGHAGADRVIQRAKSRITGSSSCRYLAIVSRMAPGYHPGEFGREQLQHVFTDWFPRVIYGDLTAETVRVDVIVRNSFILGKVYTAAFLKGDGSVIKTIDYMEDRPAKCPSYDRQRSGYYGIKDGADFYLVAYNANTC